LPAFLDAESPIAVAHRGGSIGAPENSMRAFERAVGLGYRYLETDVHATADGELVVLHDATLDRVTDRAGAVAELPWREVAAARIAGSEPVPRLAELLAAWPAVRVIIDAKADQAVAPLVQVLRRAGAIGRVCVGSFSTRRLRRLRAALGPSLATSMGPAEVLRLRLAAWRLLPAAAVPKAGPGGPRSLGPVCVQIPVRSERERIPLAEPRLLAAAHAAGLPVHVWTVNQRDEMRRLLELGVDGLISDDVVGLRAVLEERGAWR
jgi:glycerophosphoryl diester phosphodiesterase